MLDETYTGQLGLGYVTFLAIRLGYRSTHTLTSQARMKDLDQIQMIDLDPVVRHRRKI